MTAWHRAISIVVADDHPVVLRGVVGILESSKDMKVVAACGDGVAAVKAIKKYAPDVALLDIAMGGLNGLEVLSSITADGHATSVVFLTATATDGQLLAAVERGAKGLLLKETATNDLIRCIRAVATGRRWLPADLLDAARLREDRRKAISDRLAQSLTSRERQVMLLVAQSLSNKEIGRRLDLSEGTIKIHLHNIYQKVGVNNRTALATLTLAYRDRLNSADDREG